VGREGAVVAADEQVTSRELEQRLKAIREVIDERDRLYKERDEARRIAVDAALMAVKEQTKASFEASEKAIVKAEDAQRSYNQSHNDLARKMEDQNKATMPRPETEARFHALEEKVNELRTAGATGGGVALGGKVVKDESRANLAAVVGLIALAVVLWRALSGH
jgi:ribonuclease D